MTSQTQTRTCAITADELAILLEKDKKVAGETQIQRYERLGAPKPILDIIRRGGGPAMGAQCERIFRAHWPSLMPRETKKASGTSNTGYDHRIQSVGWKRLEQKTSGLWSDTPNDFHWQHIELDHSWNGLLLVGIDVNEVRAWGMTRTAFEECVKDGRATNQGNKEKNSSEGIWMTYGNVHSCLVPILTEGDLLAFAATL